MIQVLLKDAIGNVTNVISDIRGLATALNDQAILNQTSIVGLLDYLTRNHFHTKIGDVSYYQSNVSMGLGKPLAIVYLSQILCNT